jgi:sugar lactone lactonase YvrE
MDRDRRMAALAGAPVRGGNDGEVPSRSTVPAFDQLVVDGLGHLWVRDYQADRAAPSRWSVFDQDGRWMGRVEIPTGLLVAQIGPDWILARARDEMDVESVHVYRLTRD